MNYIYELSIRSIAEKGEQERLEMSGYKDIYDVKTGRMRMYQIYSTETGKRIYYDSKDDLKKGLKWYASRGYDGFFATFIPYGTKTMYSFSVTKWGKLDVKTPGYQGFDTVGGRDIFRYHGDIIVLKRNH